VPRLFDPQEGEVLLDGVPLRALDLDALRAEVGFVPQESLLFSETLASNIAYGVADDADGGVPARLEEAATGAVEPAGRDLVAWAADIAHLTETVTEFPGGFDTLLGERGVNLSGGQKQRAAIARALARRPGVVLLDDALSAVDTQTEAAILRGLRTALAGRTTLIATHRVSAVRDAAFIVVLDDGRVVEQGPHDALVAAGGRYAQLVRRQQLEADVDQAEADADADADAADRPDGAAGAAAAAHAETRRASPSRPIRDPGRGCPHGAPRTGAVRFLHARPPRPRRRRRRRVRRARVAPGGRLARGAPRRARVADRRGGAADRRAAGARPAQDAVPVERLARPAYAAHGDHHARGILRDGMLGPLSDRQVGSVEGIIKGGHQLLQMVGEILTYARGAAGQLALSPSTFALGPVVEQMFALNGPLAETRLVELVAELAPDLPVVRADREKLSHVLSNLVGNAIHFTGAAGGGRVWVRATAPVAPDDALLVEVADTGSGSPPSTTTWCSASSRRWTRRRRAGITAPGSGSRSRASSSSCTAAGSGWRARSARARASGSRSRSRPPARRSRATAARDERPRGAARPHRRRQHAGH
jgi:signal transduction histidine kinase